MMIMAPLVLRRRRTAAATAAAAHRLAMPSVEVVVVILLLACFPLTSTTIHALTTRTTPPTSKSVVVAAAAALSKKPSSLAHRSAVETGFVEILETANGKGLGAFCTRPIAAHSYIGEYYGEILTHSQVQARYFGKSTPTADDDRWALDRRTRQQGTTGQYVFALKQHNLFVDAEDAERSGWCRFMNHAAEETVVTDTTVTVTVVTATTDEATTATNTNTNTTTTGVGMGDTTNNNTKHNNNNSQSNPACNVRAFDRLTSDSELLVYPQFYATRDIEKGEELCYFYGVHGHLLWE